MKYTVQIKIECEGDRGDGCPHNSYAWANVEAIFMPGTDRRTLSLTKPPNPSEWPYGYCQRCDKGDEPREQTYYNRMSTS